MIKDRATLHRYAADHAALVFALENLTEFVASMPALDDDGNLPAAVDYGYTGSVSEMVKQVAEACRIADAMTK